MDILFPVLSYLVGYSSLCAALGLVGSCLVVGATATLGRVALGTNRVVGNTVGKTVAPFGCNICG